MSLLGELSPGRSVCSGVKAGTGYRSSYPKGKISPSQACSILFARIAAFLTPREVPVPPFVAESPLSVKTLREVEALERALWRVKANGGATRGIGAFSCSSQLYSGTSAARASSRSSPSVSMARKSRSQAYVRYASRARWSPVYAHVCSNW